MEQNGSQNPNGQQNSAAPQVELVDPAPPGGAETNLVLARRRFPPHLPIIPLQHRPLFPRMQMPLIVADEPLKKLLAEKIKDPAKYIGLVLARETPANEAGAAPRGADLYGMGVIAEIVQAVQPTPAHPVHLMVQVLDRFRVLQILQETPYLEAAVEYVPEADMAANDTLKAYAIAVIKSIKDLVQLNPLYKEELNLFLTVSNLEDPGRLADIAAALTTASGAELQEVLETVAVPARLKKVLELLTKEVDISRLQARITKQIEEQLTKQQREFFLRKQLEEIKKELGLTKEGRESEIERFEARIKKLTLPEEAQARIAEELDKLKLIETTSPEFTVTRNYLDWLTVLPWGVFTHDACDLRKAGRILDRDHAGLADVKERILEFLAVGVMKGRMAGSILCFVGPPGVGKTSLGRSIAHAVGRHFYRFSVGGIRDEAEIKGHRRTYIGALPGKFILAIKTCQSANPVIMIDEIDKVGASFHGDPASALLEVLDPEQNREFLDHYLDVRFDLSNVLFICTANQLDTIPRPLLDRMEVIKLAGYIQQEKIAIAQRHILPRQLREAGLERGRLAITRPALAALIDGYAREPGVRGLENHLKKIIRKSVKKMIESGTPTIKVDTPDLAGLLGRPTHSAEVYFKKPQPGVVMGLAWTALGGDTLFIEATRVETGTAGFQQTGQLGDVMVESAQIAYTYVRALLSGDAVMRRFFRQNFIHLHVPAGATPKDGPSAGITMACALYSLARNQAIKPGFAMTGELTLTGLVMAIGGIKEKTIAARRAGVRRLVFPQENRKDYEELPAHIRKGLRPQFVATFPEVVAACFKRG